MYVFFSFFWVTKFFVACAVCTFFHPLLNAHFNAITNSTPFAALGSSISKVLVFSLCSFIEAHPLYYVEYI